MYVSQKDNSAGKEGRGWGDQHHRVLDQQRGECGWKAVGRVGGSRFSILIVFYPFCSISLFYSILLSFYLIPIHIFLVSLFIWLTHLLVSLFSLWLYRWVDHVLKWCYEYTNIWNINIWNINIWNMNIIPINNHTSMPIPMPIYRSGVSLHAPRSEGYARRRRGQEKRGISSSISISIKIFCWVAVCVVWGWMWRNFYL